MADPTTPLKGLNIPTHGSDVGTWDTSLNSNFSAIDSFFTTVNLWSSNAPSGVALTPQQTEACRITLNSTIGMVLPPVALAGNYTVTLASSTCSGNFVFDNESTGNFSVTIGTTFSGGARTAAVAQGGRSMLTCDGANVDFADDNQKGKFLAQFGTPQGNVAGIAAASNGQASTVVWDATNYIEYVCTTTGNSATAVWTPSAPNTIEPSGYLTPISGTPIITADSIAATQLFYTPYIGNWTVACNGTAAYAIPFTEMTLTLTNSHTANTIFDVYHFNNAGTLVIGTGPAWSVNTAGSCARGAGVDLQRVDGFLTNSAQITLTNGGNTYTCPINQGIYVGSIFIDAAAGQVTCHRGFGQNRKWGIWNMFNRVPTFLKAGDNTATWNGVSAVVWRASNNNTANSVTVFSGLAEEFYQSNFAQLINSTVQTGGPGVQGWIAIGVNGSLTPSGLTDQDLIATGGGGEITDKRLKFANYIAAPAIGITKFTMLEQTHGGIPTYSGTEANMLMHVTWRA